MATVLVVSACPHPAPLRERLDLAAGHRDDVTVTCREVADPQEAEPLGMHGSPALLVGGADPFAHPGQEPSLSCTVGGLPSVDQFRDVISRADPA